MTFDDFRRWALDQMPSAARRGEDPTDDEIKVLLDIDDYDATHAILLPPLYLERDRGYLYWLAGNLPAVVRTRSLKHVAFRNGWMAANLHRFTPLWQYPVCFARLRWVDRRADTPGKAYFATRRSTTTGPGLRSTKAESPNLAGPAASRRGG